MPELPPELPLEQLARQCGSGVPPLSPPANQSRDGSATLEDDNVAAASRRLLPDRLNDPAAPDEFGPPLIGYFDPEAPIAHLSGDLPHWRQDGVTYFVTFRLADSLPQEKLNQWRDEMAAWRATHPEPHDEATRQEFYDRFPARLQRWLDAGHGSCILDIEPVRELVERALRHFHGTRYSLDEFVVASNHVHALVTPLGEHRLSGILHSWKSFTAHEILKVEAASRRLAAWSLAIFLPMDISSWTHLLRSARIEPD